MRVDIVSPVVALTANNELLFITDAVEFNAKIHQPTSSLPALPPPTSSTTEPQAEVATPTTIKSPTESNLYHQRMTFNAADSTIKPTPFAPESQPERQQGLARAVSTAKPIAFASISLGDVINFMIQNKLYRFEDYNSSQDVQATYWRHVQWVESTQWRSILSQFTVQAQADVLQKGFSDFNQYLQSISPQQSTATPNIVTVIETRPNSTFDSLIIVSFQLNLCFNSDDKI